MTKTIKMDPSIECARLPKPDGFRNVSTSIGDSGEAIRLWVREAEADAVFATESRAGASIGKSRTEQTYSAKVLVTDAGGTIEHQLPSMTATFPMIQTLPDDELLVVAPRCQRFKNGTHEMNARVHDSKGSVKCEFCLGDGIEHTQADCDGHIWVGYFDEGIFGNCGWGESGDATPLGNSGLVCYDRLGNKVWSFAPPVGFDSIADCYALNVTKSGVWACYYTDFPIISIDSSWDVRGWVTALSGVRALAVSGNSVLAYGGYTENRKACKLLQLRDRKAEEVAEVQLRLPNGLDLGESNVIGRGGFLHVFTGDEWYRFSPET
ncbi:MAG: hypothetical protein ABSD67_08045 [Terracidiphilus sp.]|jgi:hypothetical protein